MLRHGHSAALLLAILLGTGPLVAETDPLDGRLGYSTMPGIGRTERSGASDSAGAAQPASNGTFHPQAEVGYALSAGAVIGLASWDHGLGLAAGLAISDGISTGGTSGSRSEPGFGGVDREQLHAIALVIESGPTWHCQDLRLELMPDLAVGVARGSLDVPTIANSSSSSIAALLGGSSTTVQSKPAFYLGYGLHLAAYYAPEEAGSLVIGAGVGYQAFTSKVVYTANASTGGATDRLSGAAITLMVELGGRF